MGKTWHRDVTKEKHDNGEEYLLVSMPSSNGNPPPPPERDDGPAHITVFPSDRSEGDPARVIYTLKDVDTEDQLICVPKDTKLPPPGFKVKEHKHGLTIADKERAKDGKNFRYYLQLGDIRTPDPMIHNQQGGEEDN